MRSLSSSQNKGWIEMKNNYSNSVGLQLWVVSFCFTILMGLLFQKMMLPNIPSIYAGIGLMKTDSLYFHNTAVEMAGRIQTLGWSLDTIWPSSPGSKGNVTVLAIMYALFGVDPTLVLPINAVLHASSGVLVLLIVRLLCPGRVGLVAGVISAALFVALPSSLNWYAQVHKDGYAIAGTLLVLYAWLRFLNHHTDLRSIVLFVLASLAGVALILFVRPYNTVLLAAAITIWILVSALFSLVQSSWRRQGRYFLALLLVWLIILGCAAQFGIGQASVNSEWSGRTYYSSSSLSTSTAKEAALVSSSTSTAKEAALVCTNWHWQKTSCLPKFVDKYAEIVAKTRSAVICGYFDAPSNMDQDRLPNSVLSMIAYMPRAMEVSLLGPFPNMWFPTSMTRMVGTLEICIWYLLIPGFFLAFRYYRSNGLVLCVLFAASYLAVFGFTIANMGSMHRVRYPFLLLFMAVGVMGWAGLLARSHLLQARIKQYFVCLHGKMLWLDVLLALLVSLLLLTMIFCVWLHSWSGVFSSVIAMFMALLLLYFKHAPSSKQSAQYD